MPELGPQHYLTVEGWARADRQSRSGGARGRGAEGRDAVARRRGSSPPATSSPTPTSPRSRRAPDSSRTAARPAAAMTTTVRTADGRGSGWAGASHSDWSKIDPAALGRARDRQGAPLERPGGVEPGRYTVVLEPTAVGNLVQLLGFALNARNADEGRSFFTKPGGGNKIGLKVVDERVSIFSDPADPEAYAYPFAPDGYATVRTPWIENGVVKNLVVRPLLGAEAGEGADAAHPVAPHDRRQRRHSRTSSRAPSAGSSSRASGTSAPWTPGPSSITGLTRDGTFLIENGKITRAVKNLRFNESPVFMLNNLEAMGTSVRVSASEDGGPGFAIVVPPIMARDFNFTSLSDAI